MPYFIGIDIGGTNIEIGILNKKGKILIKSTIKTNSFEGIEKTFSRIWKEIQTLAREIKISQSKIVSIGIGIPGIVTNDSIVKIAANFPWGKNFNAKEIMEKISNKPVKIGNDVKLIALGELLFGRAKGYANSIIIPIGTGIAAGIISNGNLLKGHGGSAGEIGHVVIDENGYPCGCGLKGCLETYCSSKGILREAKKRLAKNQNNLLYKKIEGNLDNLEVKDIFDLASKGDKFSLKIVDFFCNYLAKGIGIILNILNPEVIVITGGISRSEELLENKIKEYLSLYSIKTSLEDVKIVFSNLKETAGIIGAASLVIETN